MASAVAMSTASPVTCFESAGGLTHTGSPPSRSVRDDGVVEEVLLVPLGAPSADQGDLDAALGQRGIVREEQGDPSTLHQERSQPERRR